MTNPFLDKDGAGTDGMPSRLYALLEQIERPNNQWFLQFDAVDADWVDQNAAQFVANWGDPAQRRAFFNAAKLYALEISLPAPAVLGRSFVPAQLDPPSLPNAEGIWFEIEGGETGRFPATLYRNLFGPGLPYQFSAILSAPPTAQDLLYNTDPLRLEPDAGETAVEAVLKSVPGPDFVAVYDVGQGNMNAVNDSAGRPLAYFDFGGGVHRNAPTFPTRPFTAACFSADPPILLSHWDKDHWSSARRFIGALALTWVVPRQAPLGKSHGALISDILLHGRLLIWSPAGGSITSGRLSLVVGTGPSRNHDGLSLFIDGPAASDGQILLPGDAAYAYIPGAVAARLQALVASHHGATLPVAGVPGCVGRTDPRLAYSAGPGNSYHHPTTPAKTDHDAVGWQDPSVNVGRTIDLVRLTENRLPSMGSISLHWSASAVPSVTCAPPCTGCALQIQQN